MKIKQIMILINEYLNDIKIFMELFNEKYDRVDVLRAWHDGSIPQTGKVAGEIEYELHGVGCCIFFTESLS